MSHHRARRLCTFVSVAVAVVGGRWSRASAQTGGPIALGPGVRVRNVADPFDYFTNSWTVIGLKDHARGTRITPSGELVLADGLLCRPLVGKAMSPLNWRVKKTLRKGYLPIVEFDFVVNGSVRYRIEALACPLDRQWEKGFDWPSGDNFLNVVRVTFTNATSAPAEAGFGLQWRGKAGPVACRVEQAGSQSRHTISTDKGRLCELELSGGASLAAREGRQEITARLAPGRSASVVARVPFRPVRGESAETFALLAKVDFDTWAERTAAFWEGLLGRGAALDVPERKPAETYRASLVYQFIGRDKGDVHAGEGFYDNLYLRDGAYQAISLAQAGYLAEAKQSLEHFFRFQGKDGFFCTQRGQLDGHGYAMWAMVEYGRLTGEAAWLRRVWPKIAKAAQWIRQARRREQDPASPFRGILPAAPADGENLWDGKHHIIGYDWWSLRGIQSAAAAARALGKAAEADALDKEFAEYRECILAALEKASLPYIPPSYEKAGTHWGNLEAIFPTVLIDPHDKRLSATLKHVRERFGAVDGQGGGFIDGVIQWSPPRRGAVHPYMSQFVTNSHIVRGEYDEAVDGFYSFLLHTTSTHGFPEGVYHRRRQAWSNTVPHLWAAALYVTTLRNMLLREQGDALHVLSAVPAGWLDEGKQIRVTGAPTHFGKLTFHAVAGKDTVRLQLGGIDPQSRLGRIVVHLPKGFVVTPAEVGGRSLRPVDARTLVLLGRPGGWAAPVTLRIRRAAKASPVTFDAKVAAFLAGRVDAFAPIPHLAPIPTDVEASKCVKLDLSRFANTNPLTAPFNVANPGRYLFTGLPVGERVVRGVPFRLLDPADGAGRGLLVLNGAEACAEFPREVEIPVGCQGRWLCILGNVTGWAAGDPGVGKWGAVGRYEIRYADRTVQTVPLITGRTVDDWAQPPAATDVAVGLRKGIWHLNVLTVALKPKPVESILFRDTGTAAAPVVAAMTVVK